MILDKGICSVFRRTDVAAPGAMPVYQYTRLYVGWYAELDFVTVPATPTENRTEVQTDARIRVLQNRDIRNHDLVVLDDANSIDGKTVYEITRAFHGHDDENGELITDLSLREVEP